jgi:hypothetical protein
MTTNKERAENLYRRLYIARMDIGEAQQHAKHLLKKGWHHQPWERRWSVYLQQAAFTTALVVAYGRAFTKSNGWPDIPSRLIPYDEDQKELHRRLMETRHTIYAHSDSKAFNIRLLATGPVRSIDRLPSLRLSKEDTELFLSMTKELLERLGRRMDQVDESLREGD